MTADDIVVRRDMLAGARIDMFGVRLSFVGVVALFLVNVALSVGAFLETLQFFEPDYTLFALSLVPLFGFGFAAYRLRPRQHFTILLRDGSALGVLSRDGNFLTRCLEAFERLWADPMRGQSSLYLHAAHRSVDFGPPAGGIDVLANSKDDGPVALTPPVFGEEDDVSSEATDDSADQPLPEMILPDLPLPDLTLPDDELAAQEEEKSQGAESDPLPDLSDTSDAPFEPPLPPPPPPHDEEEEEKDDEPVTDEATTQVSAALEQDDPSDDPLDDPVEDVAEGESAAPPPLPPIPVPLGEEDDPEGGAEAPLDTDAEEKAAERAARPFGDHVGVPAEAFVDVRSKVEALVRLLRERAPAQGISDAVDVLELMTRRGCDTPVEVRALARAVELLRERMSAYPTAVDLLDKVAEVGHLKTHPAVQ